jgi:SPP1 family predicted phage head-tail adaptor
MIDRDLRAGRLNQRILVEEPVQTTDQFGQVLYGPNASQGAWKTVITCFAHVEDMWGQEVRQSSKEISEVFTFIQVRYLSGIKIKPNMRITVKSIGTIYDVRASTPLIENGRKLVELTCLIVT